MEHLLRNDYTSHYGLPVCNTANLVLETDEPYFEIEDTSSGEIEIYILSGQGTARISNPSRLNISLCNYDKFVTSLDNSFQRGRKRCDLILICDTEKYFVLGEIKNSPDVSKHRTKAKKQLLETLTTLTAVPQIQKLVNNKAVKRCCYFNKQANSPPPITATLAFNRINTLSPDGFQMAHTDIEVHDFEFWEYTGEQTLTLTR